MKDSFSDVAESSLEKRERLERAIKKITSSSVLTMFAFGLSGCFRTSSDDSGTTYSGVAIDGPLSTAKVFIDANNNGLLDSNEKWTLTSSDGSFSLTTEDTGNLAVVTTSDTIDTSSGAIVSGLTLAAPSGSTVISPATTVVEAILDSYRTANPTASESDLATAQTNAYADTAEALGLSNDVDLTSYNPFSSDVDATSADAIAYATKSAQIVAVANTIAEAEAAAGGGDKDVILGNALSEIATQIASSAAADSVVEINGAFVDTVIASAAPTMNANATLKADVSGAVANVSSSLGAMTDVSTSGDLFYASQALLLEASVEAAIGGSSDILDVLKDNTTDISALASTLVKVTGSTRGTLSEDATADETTGDLTATGTLTLGDPDETDSTTYKFSTTVENIGSNIGSLTITEAGVWTYTYASADVASLNSLQSIDAKGTVNDGLTSTDSDFMNDSNFGLTETFKVAVLDGDGNAVELTAGVPLTKTIVVRIEGANDAVTLDSTATAIDDVGDVSQGEAITSIDASGQFTDPDTAEKLTYSATGLPAGITIDATTGVISGAPDETTLGEYSVTVTATDTGGETASTTTAFKINVLNVNDAPVATATDAVAKTATEDSAFSYDASVLFSDPDIANAHDANDALTYSMTGAPSWLSIDSSTGALSGTPENADVTSTVVTIKATDAYDEYATQEVTVTVENTNDTPSAAAVDLGILRDTTPGTYSITDFSSSVTDVDVGDTHTLTSLTQSGGTTGTIVDNGDGSFTFTPVNGEENNTVTFSYTIADAAGATASSTATLQVVDAIPVGTVDEDGGAITVTSSDYSGATYTLDSGQDAKGTYDSVSGTFTPASDFNGSVNFTLAPAGGGDSLPAIVVVSAVNDDPVVSTTATLSATEDTAKEGTIAATDVDGDTLTYTYSTPSKGTITDSEADGTFTYTPNANVNGTDTFTITVNENGSASSITQEVTVTIDAVADAPTGDATKSLTVTEDTTSTDNSIGVTDGDGDTLTFTASTPSKGSIAITDSTNGTYSYVPSANATGTDEFTWTVSDGDSSTADFTQTVSVTIDAVNDDPVSTVSIADANSTSTYTLSSNLSTYFSDADGDTLSYSASSTTGTATVTDGALSITGLTPGTTTVTVTATDGKGGTDATDSFDLTVLGDLITSTVTTVGNTHTVALTLNMDGVQTETMTHIDGFNFTIGATGSPTSSSGIDKSGLNYASSDSTSSNRTSIKDDYGVSLYQFTGNFKSDNFNTTDTWGISGGDAVALATEEATYMVEIGGTAYDLKSYLEESFQIGTLTFETQSDLTDLDLVINGSISGSNSSNPVVSVDDEVITAVTIDII